MIKNHFLWGKIDNAQVLKVIDFLNTHGENSYNLYIDSEGGFISSYLALADIFTQNPPAKVFVTHQCCSITLDLILSIPAEKVITNNAFGILHKTSWETERVRLDKHDRKFYDEESARLERESVDFINSIRFELANDEYDCIMSGGDIHLTAERLRRIIERKEKEKHERK